MTTTTTITQSSAKRIQRFVDKLIQSEYVENQWGTSDDVNNDPERAERCYDAAENGSDGSTHSERIEDMRNGFKLFLGTRTWNKSLDRVTSAVDAHFDGLELWHEKNGTLHQEIG